MSKFTSLIFTALLLVGCITPDSAKYAVVDNKLPANLPADHGYVIGTLGSDDSNYRYSVFFEFRSADHQIKQGSSNYSLAEDILNPFSGVGNNTPFMFAIPAGKYEFFSFNLRVSTGLATKEFFPKSDFSIPFEVVPGKVSYVGSIKHIPTMGENMFGLEIPSSGYFIIKDDQVADIPAITQKYKLLNGKEIYNSVPKSGNVPPQIVRFE